MRGRRINLGAIYGIAAAQRLPSADSYTMPNAKQSLTAPSSSAIRSPLCVLSIIYKRLISRNIDFPTFFPLSLVSLKKYNLSSPSPSPSPMSCLTYIFYEGYEPRQGRQAVNGQERDIKYFFNFSYTISPSPRWKKRKKPSRR